MLYVIENLLLLLFLYGLVTQVIMPLYQGVPLFPVFRKVSELEDKVSEANEDVVEAELTAEARSLKQVAKSIKKETV